MMAKERHFDALVVADRAIAVSIASGVWFLLAFLSVGRVEISGVVFFASGIGALCLGLAYRAIETGGVASAVLNAANEIAVAAFLDHRLSFDRIPRLIAAVMDVLERAPVEGLDHLLAVDAEARSLAEQHLARGVF